jgi:hypothetical protein
VKLSAEQADLPGPGRLAPPSAGCTEHPALQCYRTSVPIGRAPPALAREARFGAVAAGKLLARRRPGENPPGATLAGPPGPAQQPRRARHQLRQDDDQAHRRARPAGWLEQVESDDQPELRAFAARIHHDLAAVTAGLTLPYSSGPVEGNVNRIILWNQNCQIDCAWLWRTLMTGTRSSARASYRAQCLYAAIHSALGPVMTASMRRGSLHGRHSPVIG